MKRRYLVFLLPLLSTILLLAACKKNASGPTESRLCKIFTDGQLQEERQMTSEYMEL